MSDHVTPCVTGCGRPGDGYFLCRWCTDDLRNALSSVPEVLAELEINETRASRYGSGVGRSGGGDVVAPLPYDPGAAFSRDLLVSTLHTWARDLVEQCGEPCEADTVDQLAWWLRARVQVMRTHPAADELHRDLTRTVARSWRAVDRPTGRIYVGPCGASTTDGVCGCDLYARADPSGTGKLDPRQNIVRCECGAEWDAEQRRTWLLGELRETLATATEIASAAGMLAGRQISKQTVHTWGVRGVIVAYGNRPTRYRIGEVIDRAASLATRTDHGGRSTPQRA